ncbi:MAG: ATPase V [Bacteroidales bacterium]|nr:ATPase V [Bacteroidales bacterium]
MTRYSFILLNGDQEGFIARLQELGLVDIVRSEKPVDTNSRAMAARAERCHALIQALQGLRFPEDIRPQDPEGPLADAVENGLQRLQELDAALAEVQKEAQACAPWGDFSEARFRALAEAGVPLHFHILPAKAFQETWADEYALAKIAVQDSQVYFVVAGTDDGLPGEVPAPARSSADAQAEEQALTAQRNGILSRLQGAAGRIPELEAEAQGALGELDRYLAGDAGQKTAEEKLVTYIGYAPSESDAMLSEALDRMGVCYFAEAAKAEDNPPIKLKNNWFSRQFEVLTTMYGSPVYDEFDPTPILGPFFLLFFALCMGDAGYGLLLLLLGPMLKKWMPSMAKFAPLVTMLGGTTLLVGLFLHTFFGINLQEAGWVPQEMKRFMLTQERVAGYDAQMVLAIGVGVFHICLATVVKALCYTRRYGFANTLGTWGWTLLIVGGVVLAGLTLAGAIGQDIVRIAVIALGTLSAVGIFLLNDIHRNPLLNIGAGFWATYNTATGLLGDVLSYLRLFALGMAGGMLGHTFNMLAGMVLHLQVPVLNILCFVLILLIGHSLNLALSCLGAFVHPLRLTFVEYFKNSGYEGTGRAYRPLQINNK